MLIASSSLLAVRVHLELTLIDAVLLLDFSPCRPDTIVHVAVLRVRFCADSLKSIVTYMLAVFIWFAGVNDYQKDYAV